MFQSTFLDDAPTSSLNTDQYITGFKGRLYQLGSRVRGYRDLNSKNSELFSIQAIGGLYGGKVLDHGVSVIILHAKFNVRLGGQQMARKTGRRSVHAFVEGLLSRVEKQNISDMRGCWDEITYNPFYTDTFIEKNSGKEVVSARLAILQQGSVYCQGVTYR